MKTTSEKTTVTSGAQTENPSGGKVVIAFDGSDESRRAVEVAGHLLAPRPAVVVFVGPLPDDEGDALLADDLGVGDYEVIAVDEQAARTQAAQGTELARKAGFMAESSSILATPAWMGIIDVADEVDASVIVVGSRGVNRLHEDLEGSTSHDLARHAGRPVLIVPPVKDH